MQPYIAAELIRQRHEALRSEATRYRLVGGRRGRRSARAEALAAAAVGVVNDDGRDRR